MTKRRTKRREARRKIPKRDNVAAVFVDRESRRVIFVTKDMLTNQLYRDGPRIAVSFDELARRAVVECSEVMSRSQAMLIMHLPRVGDNGSKATCARLLFSAVNSYVAAIEVARKGYPRELGAMMRLIVETIATVLAIAIDGASTLKKYHDGKLETTKCIGIAKKALPFIGQLNGELSANFIHVSMLQNVVNGPTPYKTGDQRLEFVVTTIRLMALLLEVTTELVFASDLESRRYWEQKGEGWTFAPSDATREWMGKFAPHAYLPSSDEAGGSMER